jgi:hypothetical protein
LPDSPGLPSNTLSKTVAWQSYRQGYCICPVERLSRMGE